MAQPLVVITGASSGFGAACATTFSNAGFPLLLLARRTDKMQALKLPHTLCRSVDVCDQKAFAEAVREAEHEFGPTDCLINNAGVMLLGQIATQDPSEFKRMLDINLMGVLNGIGVVLSGMLQRQRGTIINISSIAGRKTFPNHAAYCATKFGLHALSENLREEVSQSNVRVCVIGPGAAETELLSHTTDPQIIKGYEAWKHEMGGIMAADDVARAVKFVYDQPQSVCIRELLLAATKQAP